MCSKPVLSRAELDCLAWLAEHEGTEPRSCADAVLAHLMELGLVEKADLIWLPLEMKRIYYRLTERGRQVLEET